MMHQPIFDYLRTKKALGYIAAVREWTRNGISGIAINCSSKVTRHKVEHVVDMMMESVRLLMKQFEAMTEEQFQKSTESYVKFLAKPSKSLKNQFMRNDRELMYETHRFDREAEESKKLPEITREQFIKFYEGWFFNLKLFISISKHTF